MGDAGSTFVTVLRIIGIIGGALMCVAGATNHWQDLIACCSSSTEGIASSMEYWKPAGV